MLIGELANATGTTIRALRYYEQQGLLHPQRAPNGYREYDETAVGRVANIKLLLSLGLTSQDVRAFLPCLDQAIADGPLCPASARLIARRLMDVEEKIAALGVVRAHLTEALTRPAARASRTRPSAE
ncbi:MerR family transcriptional regulator [Streptomyces sparsogenes]|uniref:MerR family transcriptional regulator n=1 Tax=Streptomyces sparsogenes DSM 40356 TaxID=1331668 RepID=A0A1R1SNK6_9ACTN|nr:MerR family transcriptional regulator [Streptomyces sparsogenes]OMI39579.1 MerR family transcriptional regulator [Streptomyces sparsogenes DSM 40356]